MHISIFSYLLKNDKQQKCHVLKQLQAFFITIAIDFNQKFIHMKNLFWGKRHVVLIQSNAIGSLCLVYTHSII
jgi:hypothetical protein